MAVVDYLVDNLLTLGYSVFLQGTFSGAEYPDSFITYIVNSSDDRAHYDDEPDSFNWGVSVLFYSKNPELLFSVPDLIRAKLKNAGFIPQGKGYNIYSDDPNYAGWTTDYLFFEKDK